MKIGLISLGCPKNLVDSEVMLGLAQQAGHELTRDAADADVLVVNTCAFIDEAKQESIDTILEMAELKKTGALHDAWSSPAASPNGIATSCRTQIPEIDAVLGTGEVPDIVAALGGAAAPVDRGWSRRPLRASHRPSRLAEPEPPALGARTSSCRPTSTTPTPRACSRRRGTTPT